MKKLLHYQFSLAGLQHDMVAIFGLWLGRTAQPYKTSHLTGTGLPFLARSPVG